jgi:hypothetical protein
VRRAGDLSRRVTQIRFLTAEDAGEWSRLRLEALPNRAATIVGLEQVLLSVTRTQIAALALYRSLGFEPFDAESQALNTDGEFIDEHYLALRPKETHSRSEIVTPRECSAKRKSALTFSVQDASAALPQNCQTTNWIVEACHFCVNVTLVMELAQS